MSIREMCLTGLSIAMVTVCTMVLQIPVSATQGYVHLGDSMILLIAVFFGKKQGMIAGGIGSALADLLCGYAHWVLFTFVIKGLMGFIVGAISDFAGAGSRFFSVRNILACAVGVIWMVFGYFVGSTILKGSVVIAATSIPENLMQGIVGTVIFLVVGWTFYKAKLYRVAPSGR